MYSSNKRDRKKYNETVYTMFINIKDKRSLHRYKYSNYLYVFNKDFDVMTSYRVCTKLAYFFTCDFN